MPDAPPTDADRARPAGVPSAAWWSPDDGEWVLGPKDDDGALHGPVDFWRPDGTLCCSGGYHHGTPRGPTRRLHETGEVAQTCAFDDDGALHGTRTFFAATGPTTEGMHANGLSRRVARAEFDYHHGALRAIRYFDADGARIDRQGQPLPIRPAGVPADAEYSPKSAHWIAGTWDGEGRKDGPMRVFRADGRPLAIETYRADTLHGPWIGFYPEGSMWWSFEYADGAPHGVAEHHHRGGGLARRARFDRGAWAGPLEDWSPSGASLGAVSIAAPAPAPPAPRPAADEQALIDAVDDPARAEALAARALSPAALAHLVARGWGGEDTRDADAARAARRIVRRHGAPGLAAALRATGLDTAPRLLTTARLRRVRAAVATVDAVDDAALVDAFVEAGGIGLTAALDGEDGAALAALRRRIRGHRLDLKWQGLEALPRAVRYLPTLREIDAGDNRLAAVPPEVADVFMLERLRLGNNRLEGLPAALGRLRGLRVLHIDGNRLDRLPEAVPALTELQILNLADNRLTALPEGVAALDRLHTLWLHGNPLATLPGAFAALPSLSFLHLGGAPWATPPPVIYEMPALRELWIASRHLTHLPPEIARLTGLERLHIWHSSLTALPDALFEMTHLRELRISGNPLPDGTIDRLKEALPDCTIY